MAAAIDVAYLGEVFQHTPAAFDLDGDSIVYELITPLMNSDAPVPGYQTVDMIAPGPLNSWSFDRQTGITLSRTVSDECKTVLSKSLDYSHPRMYEF